MILCQREDDGGNNDSSRVCFLILYLVFAFMDYESNISKVKKDLEIYH